MFCSLHCTNLLSPQLNFFFKYFILFDGIINRIAFLISFQMVHYQWIKTQLIFYIDIYPANLLNLFSIYNIMTSANRHNFNSSFPVWVFFISFPCLSAVARMTSSTMLNRISKRVCTSLPVPDLGGKIFNFSLL